MKLPRRKLALSCYCGLIFFGSGILSGCTYASTTTPAPVPTAAAPEPRPVEATEPARDAPPVEPFIVMLRYADASGPRTITASEGLVVSTEDRGLQRLPAGRWRVSHRQTRPARLVYPVYVKAYKHDEIGPLKDARENWRAQGYATFVTTLGRAITGPSGVEFDSRTYWLGIRRCTSEAEAAALKKQLQAQKVWAWSREEVWEPPQGVLSFADSSGAARLTTSVPVRIRTTGLVAIDGARAGKAPINVPGPLELRIARDGTLAVEGEVPLEYYLRGILPAEMYPDWPLEALKAQAVAARSEIIAHAAGKHYFDGFDFCIEQHCRAFRGDEGHHERTDRAVRETTGMVLVGATHEIVPTVFSANCGGWTENNENVWDGAPAAALRGRSDRVGASPQRDNGAVTAWISGRPESNCAHDGEYYRWSRTLPLSRLSKRFDAQYGIGHLRRIEALERGVSGRLKAVRLVGTKSHATVRKELNIRRAFDNLPSALCLIELDAKQGAVRVRGAGRGHGVGLCQQGAFGMARADQPFDAILRHYFSGVKITEI